MSYNINDINDYPYSDFTIKIIILYNNIELIINQVHLL